MVDTPIGITTALSEVPGSTAIPVFGAKAGTESPRLAEGRNGNRGDRNRELQRRPIATADDIEA